MLVLWFVPIIGFDCGELEPLNRQIILGMRGNEQNELGIGFFLFTINLNFG